MKRCFKELVRGFAVRGSGYGGIGGLFFLHRPRGLHVLIKQNPSGPHMVRQSQMVHVVADIS
jgi:hypothetical protein